MSSALVPTAVGDPISDKQAQAAALASQIQALGIKEAGLSEQYDGAKLALAQATASVGRAAADAVAARHTAAVDQVALGRVAVEAYVEGGSGVAQASAPASANAVVNAESSLIRAEYVNNLSDSQSQLIEQYRVASQNADDARVVLLGTEATAATTAARLSADRQATIVAGQQLQNTLSEVKGQLAQLVAAAEAAREAAAAKAAQAALAAQRAALAAAAANAAAAAPAQPAEAQTSPASPASPSPTSAVTPSPSNVVAPVTTPSPAASLADQVPTAAAPATGDPGAAVSAALSRVGLPYVYGAAGPDSFDCSGLVQWAWAHAGVSLPHYSGAQYADTTHISMSDLQPGDLVFPSDPGQHVAMYIGGGQIVEAPYTGAYVHVVALSSFFVYASRP